MFVTIPIVIVDADGTVRTIKEIGLKRLLKYGVK